MGDRPVSGTAAGIPWSEHCPGEAADDLAMASSWQQDSSYWSVNAIYGGPTGKHQEEMKIEKTDISENWTTYWHNMRDLAKSMDSVWVVS